MRKIKLINETHWRTTEIATIIAKIQAAADPDHVPKEITIRCGRTNDRKPLEQRFSFYREGGRNYSGGVTITIPCEPFPVRGLASVIARGFNLLNKDDHTLRPLRERVLAVRVIKAAGRLPLTRVGKREERAPQKPNTKYKRSIYK